MGPRISCGAYLSNIHPSSFQVERKKKSNSTKLREFLKKKLIYIYFYILDISIDSKMHIS